jgi:ubiquinone/menaquinone biosynthesis C-methylase UbiE
MSTPDRPDNPFAAGDVGRLYARGRPYHHPRALARILQMVGLELVGVTGVGHALDVACGTGMSSLALAELGARVTAVDLSPEMLAVAPRRTEIAYVRADAERLPIPDATIDAVTVSSGVHWFDQPRFFAEVRRVLRADGWVGLYDHYFIGEMVDAPAFAEWTRVAFERYPLPPRNPQVGDPRAQTPDGFVLVGDQLYAEDLSMTHEQFVDYQLSVSHFVAAVERGERREDARAWLVESTAPFWTGNESRVVRFLGSVTCLRPALP